MTAEPVPAQPVFLRKKLVFGITPAFLFLIAIMLLASALHLYKIQSIGDANAYYTAAVESMLKSWSNFFFVAAEPGGSVTVDKPPLGLWIEALFAFFLGVSGFSVSLPNILAGIFSIPLLYSMVKKHMGELAGLVAALVTALTPVFVATNRNNTMDGMLVFFLLMAAWAFIRATETGKTPWLMLGAFIVGLGFNIKMMQAFLPLPAFYMLYFLGSKEGWFHKLIKLGFATVLLLAISLSWAVVVDLVPADQRPYIGSSGDNTVMGLIFGHNGGSRLVSNGGPQGEGSQAGQTPQTGPAFGQPSDQGFQTQAGIRNGPPQEALTACVNSSLGASCSFTMPFGTVNGTCITPPNSSRLTCAPEGAPGIQSAPRVQGAPNGQPQGFNDTGGGAQFSQETGEPGVFRFFTQPLSKQMSWLLPFALISIAVALFSARIRLPVDSGVHKALILWGGWLLTCVVFFSVISGIFHSYYAIMLVPALGAVVGIGFAQLWDLGSNKSWAGILLIAAAAITIAFQLFASHQYGEMTLWMILAGILFVGGSLLMVVLKRTATITLLAAMLVIPAYWTIMTIASNPNINLPTAYQGSNQQAGPDGVDRARRQDGGNGSNVNEELLAYLQSNTQGIEYLLAVPSSQTGASLVLASGRPVLYMGGFGGQDEVVSAEDLSEMVANGELRYVLYGSDRGGKQDIASWLAASCSIVPQFSNANSGTVQPVQGQDGQNRMQGQVNPREQQTALYLCR